MSQNLDVPLDEVKRVFDLLDKVNSLFHQPMRYEDPDMVKAFADSNYKEIHELFYNVVWDWLPESVKVEIVDN